jgi:hypothetical protein
MDVKDKCMSTEKTDDKFMIDPFQTLDARVAEIDRLENARRTGQTLEFETMEQLRWCLADLSAGLFGEVERLEP